MAMNRCKGVIGKSVRHVPGSARKSTACHSVPRELRDDKFSHDLVGRCIDWRVIAASGEHRHEAEGRHNKKFLPPISGGEQRIDLPATPCRFHREGLMPPEVAIR